MKQKHTVLARFAQSALVLAATSLAAGAQANTVISEVLYDAAGTDRGNVFVELFGSPGTALNGLFLEGVNGADGSVYKTAVLSGTIPSDGIFVIGDDSGNGASLVNNVDLVLDVEFQNGPDSIVLRDSNGILDALGYGDFSSAVFAGEGNAAPDVASGWSLARSNPLADTGDNAADFFGLNIPTPGVVPASPVPLPPALALFLSGFAGLVGVSRRRV